MSHPLIDIGTVGLIRQGAIGVRPGVVRFTQTGVAYTDGRNEDWDTVVLATGFRPRVDRFFRFEGDAVVDSGGTPRRSGIEAMPGLWFCGFWVSPTGMLREIGIEAQRIAEAIAARG